MRSLYSAVKVRRLALATTSGSGRDGAAGSGATVLPATALRSASLRSASLRSAAGKTVGEAPANPFFFTLIPMLALLCNYDQVNCLINVGTEGGANNLAARAAGVQVLLALGDAAGVTALVNEEAKWFESDLGRQLSQTLKTF